MCNRVVAMRTKTNVNETRTQAKKVEWRGLKASTTMQGCRDKLETSDANKPAKRSSRTQL